MTPLAATNRPVKDYTSARLGSRTERGRKIGRCPDCGRKGEAVTYRGGDQMFAHRAEFDGLGWSVTDHCFIAVPR